MYVLFIFLAPDLQGKRFSWEFLRPCGPIDSPAQAAASTGAGIDLEASVAPALTAQDRHDGPVGRAEDTPEGLFVGAAG